MADQNNDWTKNERVVKDQVALVTFVDKLLKERNDSSIAPETLPKLRQFLLKEVNDAINRHLINLLTDKEQLELDDLLNKNVSSEELDAFFEKKIPQLDAEIAVVLLNFRNAYLYPVRDKLRQQTKSDSKNLQTPTPPQPAPMNHESSDFPPMPAATDKVN